MTVEREILYKEVWAAPMTKVAARYGVSSSFLARVCERLNVPRPARGHWAKLKHGKATVQPDLPSPRPGDEEEWNPGGEQQWQHAPPRTRRSKRRTASETLPQAGRRRHKKDRPAKHALIMGAREHFNKVRTSVYDEKEELHLKPMKQLLVDVCTSKATIDAALELANELLLTLEDRGYRAVLAPHALCLSSSSMDVREEGGQENERPMVWRPLRPTVVFIGTVAIGIAVYEMTESVELRRVDGEYVPVDAPIPKLPHWQTTWTVQKDIPSGRLAVLAYCPQRGVAWERTWTEKKPGSLKSKCTAIVRELVQAAPLVTEHVENAEREAEERQEKWEIERLGWEQRETERLRLLAEKASGEHLLSIIKQWSFACRIERFFTEVSKAADKLEGDDRSNILDRLDQARALHGGPDALKWFREWKLAEERLG